MAAYNNPRPSLPAAFTPIASVLFPNGIFAYGGTQAAHSEITANATRLGVIDGKFHSQQVVASSQAYNDLMIEKVLLTERNRFLTYKLGL